MKILVLGAKGMLGRDLVALLSPRGDVTGADIDQLDISDAAATSAFVRARAPRVVINTAARTDVDGCESNASAAFAVNAEGAGNVARACAAAGARMVHLSTDYVFDGQRKTPYREGDPVNPRSVYGLSKLAGEQAVAAGVGDHVIVRTSWLFGIHGKNFVDTIVNAAATRKLLEVVGDQRGSPTYSPDLAAAIAALLATDYRGIVHVTNSGTCTWCEYAREILSLAGITDVEVREITSDHLARPAPRPAYSVLDCSLYTKLTGSAMRHWREAVGAYLGVRRGGREAAARRA